MKALTYPLEFGFKRVTREQYLAAGPRTTLSEQPRSDRDLESDWRWIEARWLVETGQQPAINPALRSLGLAI